MFRLGIRLTFNSGREAFVRLVVTAVAVAVGVTIMLAVLADFHAFQVTNDRPNWEGTQAMAVAGRPASDTELWNYSDEVFRGQTIERLDVAALGPHAPVPPGISRLPAAGQYYASPALAALIRGVPADQLAARFPGRLAGTIGDAALTGPDELVVYIGEPPRALAGLPTTIRVDAISQAPGKQVWSHYFRDAFIVAALAFLLPILVLLGTATRLASARREERYASLRLVGATTTDINVIASADAIMTALVGAIIGAGLFSLLRPVLAGTAITSQRYFAAEVTPTTWGYLVVLAGVPAVAAVSSLFALRRVRITPLGVSRRVTPPRPSAWRVLPLLAGVALFVTGMLLTNSRNIGAPAFPGLLLTMIGLVVAGPWLTERAARLLPRLAVGASPVYAARRLADDPKAAFRSVSGLVLAVFLGTVTAALLPAINATTATPSAVALNDVLLDSFQIGAVCGNTVNCTGTIGPVSQPGTGPASLTRMELEGLPAKAGARLLTELGTFRGITVAPIWSPASDARPDNPSQYTGIVDCASMAAIHALGTCARGDRLAQATSQSLYGDNPLYTSEVIVSGSSPASSADVRGLYLQAVLIKVPDSAALERVRTFLITHTRESVSGTAPRTFGEEVQARLAVAATAYRLIDVAVVLTLLVAGCSLAVSAGGGLVERKRPFTIMRLTGTPVSTLGKVVMTESVLPLVAATVVAAGTAYAISLLTIAKMAPAGTPIPGLGHVYYETIGAGLVISLAVIAATLPLLSRITSPENVRFE
ncbi:MAG TPA: ABC transporter permease [Streptosporangiaceae bacterium]|nr:ABC transporter permease [Streptosporangiaceae bacterium]